MRSNLEDRANSIEEHQLALGNDVGAIREGLRNIMQALHQISNISTNAGCLS
jgi:hypothetical protein